MKKTAAAAALSLALTTLLLFPEQAGAANGSVTCSVVSATLGFNAYNPISGSAETLPPGSITVQCTSTSNSVITVTYNLTLATSPARAMASGANSVTYDLYTDSARTIQWNTTNQVSCTFNLAANVANQQSPSCSFYGTIPGSQDVPAGTYTQTGLAVGGTWSCNPLPSQGC